MYVEISDFRCVKSKQNYLFSILYSYSVNFSKVIEAVYKLSISA